MHEGYSVVMAFLLLSIAWIVIVCSLSGNKKIWWFLPLFLVVSMGGYLQWGNWFAWNAYRLERIQEEKAKQLLASIKSPQALIILLQNKLKKDPSQAKGWYFLGRLYRHEGLIIKAKGAFAKAYQLNPRNEDIAVNYAQILLQSNPNQYNETVKGILTTILKVNPQQGDALAMLAINAYNEKDYKAAALYWKRLLALVPEDSAEARAIRKALIKLHNKDSNE